MHPVMGSPMQMPVAGVFDFLGNSVRPEAELWAGTVRANGGAVVNEDVAIVSAFIAAEDAAGIWALTDDYHGLWAPNSVQARVSIKQRRLMTMTGSPTHTANRDYAFNGSTQYGDTGFVPLTHAVSMTASSARIDAYERTNVATNTYAAGVADASNKRLTVCPCNASGIRVNGEANAALGAFAIAGDSRGLTSISRNGGTAADCVAYKNGVALTRTIDPSGFGAALPGYSIFIGGFNSAGALSNPRASSIGFVSWGASLTAAQSLVRYNNVQAWATIRGANV
ncbi:MAG: hypothetical protein E6Q76_15670 [Rhizobium sp.]|nr:MAG: hypothetical protein E6Q76_15670 [Rhizobium sp.]